jgi:hypothetical protein
LPLSQRIGDHTARLAEFVQQREERSQKDQSNLQWMQLPWSSITGMILSIDRQPDPNHPKRSPILAKVPSANGPLAESHCNIGDTAIV